ncbi:MAG: hypothetical protein ACJAY5_000823 [Actinomycetes bacterium]|jgi:hypothetical protein
MTETILTRVQMGHLNAAVAAGGVVGRSQQVKATPAAQTRHTVIRAAQMPQVPPKMTVPTRAVTTRATITTTILDLSRRIHVAAAVVVVVPDQVALETTIRPTPSRMYDRVGTRMTRSRVSVVQPDSRPRSNAVERVERLAVAALPS